VDVGRLLVDQDRDFGVTDAAESHLVAVAHEDHRARRGPVEPVPQLGVGEQHPGERVVEQRRDRLEGDVSRRGLAGHPGHVVEPALHLDRGEAFGHPQEGEVDTGIPGLGDQDFAAYPGRKLPLRRRVDDPRHRWRSPPRRAQQDVAGRAAT
jgi:hypothetical protein